MCCNIYNLAKLLHCYIAKCVRVLGSFCLRWGGDNLLRNLGRRNINGGVDIDRTAHLLRTVSRY